MMIRLFSLSLSLSLAAGLCLLALGNTSLAEEKVDWSKFHSSGNVKGVIEKIEKESITLSVPKLERGKTSSYRGGRNRRPSIKVGHEDVELSFAEQGLVRWEKLPKKTDGKAHTSKELEDARKPTGAPGYAATRDELKVGQSVELHLVHPSSIPDAKLTVTDVVIKYLVIEGETAPPPHADKTDPKKK